MALIESIIQGIASGILMGGFLAALAVGLNLIWGVMRYINLPHMGLAILGTFICYYVWKLYAVEPHIGLVLAVPILFLIGAGIQRFLMFTERRSPGSSLIILFAILFILEGSMVAAFTNYFRRIDTWYTVQSLFIGNIALPIHLIFAFIAGALLTAVCYFLLQRTYLGLAIRAAAEDSGVALSMGVNTSNIYIITFGLATGIGAVGGIYVGFFTTFFPDLQFGFIAKIFAIVVLGGLGSIVGTMIGAVVIGLADALTSILWSNAWADPISYAILIIILLFRPQGLFGRYR